MSVALVELCDELPLANGWGEPICHEETVHIAELEIRVVGLLARADARDVDATGSAAELTEYPYARAYYELLERTAIFDAMALPMSGYEVLNIDREVVGGCTGASIFPESPSGSGWAFARSNGMALRGDWRSACLAARAELVERHRVLLAWSGATTPELMEPPAHLLIGSVEYYYEVEVYRFQNAQLGFDDIEVAGVFAFPRSPAHPLAYGFGAAANHSAARDHATRECLQRLGFLWGEPLPTQAPRIEPSAAYHQELYLWPPTHSRLRHWLRRGHTKRGGDANHELRLSGYVDLTPPHLAGQVCVVKAVAATDLPLVFGRGHPRLAEVEAEVGPHPIT